MRTAGRAFIPSDDSGGLHSRFCFLRAFCAPGDFQGQGRGILNLASTGAVNPGPPLQETGAGKTGGKLAVEFCRSRGQDRGDAGVTAWWMEEAWSNMSLSACMPVKGKSVP